MSLPINTYTGKPRFKLSDLQERSLETFLGKLKSGEYKYISNPCLCGNNSFKDEYIVTFQDRYGIEMKNVICEDCGLIRPTEYLDEKSTIDFYTHEYRALYGSGSMDIPTEDFFLLQQKIGKGYLEKFLEVSGDLSKEKFVFEVGCGAGGIILPFLQHGYKKVVGCDFNDQYLEFGREKGLDLLYGDFYNHVSDEEVDIVVLSMVFEHFTDPLREMNQMIRKIKKGGYLIFAIPGIFDMHLDYIDPILYFQNAHVFNFYEDYLRIMFEKFGMEVLYGNEMCRFIVRKPLNWKEIEVTQIKDERLKKYPNIIKEYIVKTDNSFKYKTSKYYYIRKYGKSIGKILDIFGLKKYFSKFIN